MVNGFTLLKVTRKSGSKVVMTVSLLVGSTQGLLLFCFGFHFSSVD